MSRKRRKARQIGVQTPPIEIEYVTKTENVVAFEKPKAPAMKHAVAQISIELLGSEALFKEFAPFLQKGCDLSRDRYTPQWLWMMAMQDDMQIWAVLGGAKPAGAFVTTTQLYPATGLHVLQVVILGGEGIIAARDKIREALLTFKKQRQCHRIEWVGRSGLEHLWSGCERIGVACEVG
jgi:hypothetical protein